MTHDRPLLGILLMLGFCVLAPMQDTMAKMLGSIIPLVTLLFARFSIQAVLLVPLCLATGRRLRLPKGTIVLAWVRAGLHILGIGAMFTALQHLPLADAVAIAFVMPFIMLLLGWWFLGESVGPRRIFGCLVGFAGTLLVVQPAFNEVGWPALLPVFVALIFALYMLLTRKMAKDVDPIALQAVSGFMSSFLLLPIAALLWWMDMALLPPQMPEGRIWLLLVGIGVLGTAAHLMMSWSLRYAPSTTLAPMQYLEIPVATFFGWLAFGDIPNGLAAVGIMITIGAGLYIIWREQATQAPSGAHPEQG